MSTFNKRRATAAANTRRVRPNQVPLHKMPETPVKVNTLRQIIATEPYLALNAVGPTAFQMESYILQCHEVMSAAIVSRIKADGALSDASQQNGARRRAQVIAHHMNPDDIERLKMRRTQWHKFLKQRIVMLLRAPPGSGGITALWTLGVGLWTLICQANLILRSNGVAYQLFDSFSGTQSHYLTRNLLVLFPGLVSKYSLSQLVQTVLNWLTRLDSLDGYEDDYAIFLGLLEHRCAQLICLSGTPLTGYDSKAWLESSGKHEQCSPRFIAHSMLWFLGLHQYLDTHKSIEIVGGGFAPSLAIGGLAGASISRVQLLISLEQTQALDWYPSADMHERVRFFFCQYAAKMVDQRYLVSMRTMLQSFIPLVCDPNIYRLHKQVDSAEAKNVVNDDSMIHYSPTGNEFMRLIMCAGTSVLQWMHDVVNWRYGDTTVRSSSLGRMGFFRELATLYIVHMWMSRLQLLRFRQRFVLFHRSPAFVANYNKAKRQGLPFFVQWFSRWCVVVMHQKDPTLDGADLMRNLERLSTSYQNKTSDVPLAAPLTSADAPIANPQQEHDDNAGAGETAADFAQERVEEEDFSSAGSYSYYSDSYDDNGSRSGNDDDDDYESINSDDDADLDRLLKPHRPPEVVRHEQAVAAAANRETADDDLARELARMTIEMAEDDGGAHNEEARRTYGDLAAPISANENFVRIYTCETFLEAYTVWLFALLHLNKGMVEKIDLTDYAALLFGWKQKD